MMALKLISKKLRRLLPYLIVAGFIYLCLHLKSALPEASVNHEKKNIVIKHQTKTQKEHNVPLPYKMPSMKTPVVTDDKIKVLLLGYQRTGSSFLGQLFNKFPDNYYAFEPVDGIYSALYGIKPGWTLASDVVVRWNGTKRSLPSYEALTVASVLKSLFTCDFKSIPAEVLGHEFYKQFAVMQTSSQKYINCMKASSTDISLMCGVYLNKMCPEIFGMNEPAQERCMWALAKYRNEAHILKNATDNFWLPHLAVNRSTGMLSVSKVGNRRGSIAMYQDPYTDSGKRTFMDYLKCMDKYQMELKECIPDLQTVCDNAKMRAIKTVRLTMGTAARLMEQLPNLHIIHLIRDPRAVVASRLSNPTYRSHYARMNVTKEAEVYCDALDLDLNIRMRIEKRYPNRVYELINEVFMDDKLGETKRVYRFMKKKVPQELTDFLVEGMKNTKMNSTKIVTKWKNLMSEEEEETIWTVCPNVFALYKQLWPL